MVSWEIDFDPAVWLPVPETHDEAEIEDWVERATRAVVNDFSAEFELAAEYPEVLRYQLHVLAENAARRAAQGWLTLAHLPGPEWYPFAVEVAFLEPRTEAPDYLLELAGASGLPAVQPPTVDHITLDDLGEGVRVTRYEQPEGFPLTAIVCYAWRAHDTDVLVFVQTDDLSRLEETTEDIAGLTRTIHPSREPSAGV